MIYLFLSGASAFFGMSSGLGPTTLLRPLLDAVSPLTPASAASLAALCTLCAALVSAFFALGKPVPLLQEELLLLAAGAFIGGVLGDLAASRFHAMLGSDGVRLLQNALLFTIIALPWLYFSRLSQIIRPLAINRLFSLPAALFSGLFGSFLAFGAEPLTLMLYFILFDAENDEASFAALTVALFSMAGKIITLFIRHRMSLPDANLLIFLLPGALIGTLLVMIPGLYRPSKESGQTLLRLSLFTSALNMAGAIL